jgi:uncharacterized protein (DUF302 family)
MDREYDEAIEDVTTALKAEGFGILTRIDLDRALKEKLGVDFRPYAILGACNPTLAHQAVSTRPDVGLMLPCNVTVEAAPSGGVTVRIADPEVMMDLGEVGDPRLQSVAAEAHERLSRVARSLEEI